MSEEIHLVDNGAGWRIALKRTPPRTRVAAGRPVLLVPGYGMNSFIFGYHPRGASFEEHLAARGLEVWSVDLRGQGRSERAGGHDRYGLADLALDDLGAAIAHVVASTRTGQSRVDLVGCSLGAALSVTHLVLRPDAPVHALVTMGGLVTWVRAHPAVRTLLFSRRLAGAVRLTHSRRLAAAALPRVLRLSPGLLSPYLNPRTTDVTDTAPMVQTVEDPHWVINREIAEWLKRRELVVRGVNVSRGLRHLRLPLFCIYAEHDGVVPKETSRAIYETIGSPLKRARAVGSDRVRVAHADLFLCNGAQELVYEPVVEFLLDPEVAAAGGHV